MGIVRIILYIILGFLIFKIVKMVIKTRKPNEFEKKTDDKKFAKEEAEQMMLDPVCKAYIEISKALPLKTDEGKTFYFCSEKCKQEFLNVDKC